MGNGKAARENLDQTSRGPVEFIQNRALVLVARLRDELLFIRIFGRRDRVWILQVVAIHPRRER